MKAKGKEGREVLSDSGRWLEGSVQIQLYKKALKMGLQVVSQTLPTIDNIVIR